MARVWDEHTTTALIEERLQKIAPNNTAPIPISCHQERSETDPSKLIWVATIHVRIRRITEYDVEGFGTTLGDALRRAYIGLAHEAQIRQHNAVANAQFGVTV